MPEFPKRFRAQRATPGRSDALTQMLFEHHTHLHLPVAQDETKESRIGASAGKLLLSNYSVTE
jgi:hypothetical protein